MASRRNPTGEKGAPRYRAPQFTPTESAEFQRFLRKQLGAIQADLDGLHKVTDKAAQVRAVATVTGALQAIAGDTLRVDPPASGIRVLLPEARAANKGQDVTILVLSAGGPVLVRAVNSTVQGVSEVTLTGSGLRVLRSDGAGGWWIVGQSSADASNALVAISAGTNVISSGTAVFSNSNGVTFGANTAGVVTGSVSTGIGLTAPGSTTTVTGLAFSNANNMSWTIGAGTGVVGLPFVNFRAGGPGNSSALSFLQFSDSNGVSFGLSTTTNNRGTITMSMSSLSFSNANNVTFGIAGSTITASASIASSLTAIRLSAGTTSNLLSQFTLSNSNNVSFGLNASVVTASVTVASTQASINLSAGTTSNLASAFTFANLNGISFGLNASTITASYTVPSIVGLLSAINVSAGTTSNNLSALTFSNLNGVTFGLNGSVVTASVGAGGAAGSISAGTTSVALGQAVFSNSNNVSFGLNGSTVTASVTVASTQGSIRVTAGTTNNLLSQLSFLNANGVTWGLDASTVTAFVQRAIALVSHIGGNSIDSVTRLGFSDASNVTWSLSTAANAATVIASVAAAGGGVAWADTATTHTSGTLLAHSGINLSTIFSAGIGGNSTRNVQLGFAGTNLTGQAHIRVDDNTAGAGQVATKVAFLASNGVTFGVFSTETGVGARQVAVTASIKPDPDISVWQNWSGNNALGFQAITNLDSTCYVFPLGMGGPFPGNMTINTLDLYIRGTSGSSTQLTNSWGFTLRGAIYTLANSTQLSRVNSFSSGVSSTTIASANSASRNNSYNGERWFTVHSSQWSAQPVLSAGVQYWIGLNLSVAGASAIIQDFKILELNAGGGGAIFNGTMGVTNSAASGRFQMPFVGKLSTGTPPASIAATDQLTAAAQFMRGLVLQFRNGISA